jgi:hypothetical protein
MRGFPFPEPGDPEYEEYVRWQQMQTAVLRCQFQALRANDLVHRLLKVAAGEKDPGAKVTLRMVDTLDLSTKK